jgi:LmbE family N-acetylglucosaminyl deacetylase
MVHPMAEPILTLMAVHAHPDDEASSTGGILARYAAEGVRTVLVTCTNGEMGDAPGGTKPEDPEHDEAQVVAARRRELDASCRALGVSHLEMLGYRDSGMEGWESNRRPDVFSQLDVDVAARPLLALLQRYRPQVVVTYDDFGFYGHPDHIQAHRITVAALDAWDSEARLYFPTIRRSQLAGFRERMLELGMEPPEIDTERMGAPDEMVAAMVDCRAHAAQKRAALTAHSSQADNLFFLRFPEDVFVEMFGIESFVRARPEWRPGIDPVADDLFAGLRAGEGSAAR